MGGYEAHVSPVTILCLHAWSTGYPKPDSCLCVLKALSLFH